MRTTDIAFQACHYERACARFNCRREARGLGDASALRTGKLLCLIVNFFLQTDSVQIFDGGSPTCSSERDHKKKTIPKTFRLHKSENIVLIMVIP